jgi:hypothetical protein
VRGVDNVGSGEVFLKDGGTLRVKVACSGTTSVVAAKTRPSLRLWTVFGWNGSRCGSRP